ncbi:MAG: hypothetical protein KGD73_10390 [Candidatus Lokiarchaeota archaeon]|nr:hypothetical protein [Candidatus Lokiarchaeota archaeon]
MTSEEAKFEIIDFSGEKMIPITLHCSTVILICTVIAIIGFFFFIISYPSQIALLISIGIIVIVILIYSGISVSGTQGMLRKFTIFESKIEILLPREDQIIIEWSQIDEIKVRLIISNVIPFQFYEITFSGENKQSKINLDLKDFKRENLKKLLKMLKIETIGRRKKFIATKEEIASGIFLVENLDI